MELCSSPDCPQFGLVQPPLSRVFHIASGIACLGYVHYGIAYLASQASDWAGALWGWPVWPVVGNPLLGVHPGISIVKLIVIGYHCNCLDGQLNYQPSAHWLISVTIMYQLCNW